MTDSQTDRKINIQKERDTYNAETKIKDRQTEKEKMTK